MLHQPLRIQQVALLSWKPSFWILLGPPACPRMQLKVLLLMPSPKAIRLLRAGPSLSYAQLLQSLEILLPGSGVD